MTNFPLITIIGAGSMGSSFIGGLIKSGHPADKLWAVDRHESKLAYLRDTFHIHTTDDAEKAAKAADVIVLAVKPSHIAHLITELVSVIETEHPLLISIAAGVRLAHLQTGISKPVSIVRAMPNTPAMIGCGATALFANTHTTLEQRNLAESIMRAVGVTVWLDKETDMDTVTALSGSGPAYFFLIMEALQQAAETFGLPKETARLLTLQTALGAARMAIESGKPVNELREHVTSKGGTTEKAIAVLETHHLRDIFKEALSAAKLRSEEISFDT